MHSSRLLFALLFIAVSATALGCAGTRTATLPPGSDDPGVVAVIGNDVLTLEEFEERYARTTGGEDVAASDSLGAYQDFLDRYVNFRLKVLAAREAGLDRDPEVLDEIETYRANLARPYLIDREVIDPLVREMYARQSELIDASHILIRVEPAAAPTDTLAAYQKLNAIRDSIIAGADFAEMAERHSEDPSARRPGAGYQGRLGYFTAGRMIDEFEDAAFETEVGAVSPVFRTSFGFHILRVEDRRDNPPEREVAHIMIVPEGDSVTMDSVEAEIAFVQEQLASGAAFEELAEQHSDDRRSAVRGGSLPPIGLSTRLPQSFIDAAFALQDVGEVSDPVETQFGLHLIKLLDKGQRPTYEEAYEELKAQVSRMPRARQAEEQFARDLWAGYGGTIDTATVLAATSPYSLDSLMSLVTSDLPPRLAGTVIGQLGDSTFTIEHFLDFVQESGVQQSDDRDATLTDALSDYASGVAIAYETAALEQRNEEFGRVMTEFREGLILFSLMEDSVWTAAAQDSVALQRHYEANRESYTFPERVRVVAFYSASDSLLSRLAAHLDSGSNRADLDELLAADSTVSSRVDTVRIAETTNSIFDRALELEEGAYAGPIRHNRDWVLLLNDGTEAPRLKTFEEARATVVSEYQDVLESALVERLRARYGVHVYPNRLQAAFSSPAPEAEPVSVQQ